jgi:predicted P-loop ATPase/GTPase
VFLVTVLVVGLLGEGSGKTILASSLVSVLRKEGIDAVGFKPVGGTEVWLHPEVLEESKARGVLVTRDALLIERASGRPYPIEVYNPIGFHVMPLDPASFNWSLKSFVRISASLFQRAAVGRVSTCVDGKVESLHFVNTEALSKSPARLSSAVMDVAQSLSPRPVKAGRELVARILEGEYVEAADRCLGSLEERHEVVVIESNSDIAAPTPASLEADVVLAVSPGVVAVVEGRRYNKAVYVGSVSGRPWSVSAEEAVELAGVTDYVELPLLQDPEEGYSYNDLYPLVEKISARR